MCAKRKIIHKIISFELRLSFSSHGICLMSPLQLPWVPLGSVPLQSDALYKGGRFQSRHYDFTLVNLVSVTA